MSGSSKSAGKQTPLAITGIIGGIVLLVVLIIAIGGGFTESGRMRMAHGGPKHVTLYSGGQKVREWTSTSRVLSESSSDGWYFVDRDTHKLVLVTGTLTIEDAQ